MTTNRRRSESIPRQLSTKPRVALRDDLRRALRLSYRATLKSVHALQSVYQLSADVFGEFLHPRPSRGVDRNRNQLQEFFRRIEKLQALCAESVRRYDQLYRLLFAHGVELQLVYHHGAIEVLLDAAQGARKITLHSDKTWEQLSKKPDFGRPVVGPLDLPTVRPYADAWLGLMRCSGIWEGDWRTMRGRLREFDARLPVEHQRAQKSIRQLKLGLDRERRRPRIPSIVPWDGATSDRLRASKDDTCPIVFHASASNKRRQEPGSKPHDSMLGGTTKKAGDVDATIGGTSNAIEDPLALGCDEPDVIGERVPRPETSSEVSGPSDSRSPARSFRFAGGNCIITFDGEVLPLRTRRGFGLMALLVQDPGREFSPLELANWDSKTGPLGKDFYMSKMSRAELQGHGLNATASSRGIPRLEKTDLEKYLETQRALEADFAVAEKNNDPGEMDRIRGELESVQKEIDRARGPAGQVKTDADPSERARVAATKAISEARESLREFPEASDLYAHLKKFIKTGKSISYRAEGGDPWHVDWGKTSR